jgi:hypothetical protein
MLYRSISISASLAIYETCLAIIPSKSVVLRSDEALQVASFSFKSPGNAENKLTRWFQRLIARQTNHPSHQPSLRPEQIKRRDSQSQPWAEHAPSIHPTSRPLRRRHPVWNQGTRRRRSRMCRRNVVGFESPSRRYGRPISIPSGSRSASSRERGGIGREEHTVGVPLATLS